jgi:predicted ABC-type exoprotein transport system permease subunit
MNLLFQLLVCFTALIVIAAAFVYPFNPEEAQKLLKRLLVALLGLVVALDLLAQLAHRLGAFCTGILILFISLTTYWVREFRKRPPERRGKLGRAERKPILPGRG